MNYSNYENNQIIAPTTKYIKGVIPAQRLCRNGEITVKVVMPAQAGIQEKEIELRQ